MRLTIGIDVGGTFTDFLVTGPGRPARSYKVLSTPADPSIGLIAGFSEIAASLNVTLEELARSVESIVHGTTVTTNAVLTWKGAATGLLTTEGVRDALEMRRGIREEQYNNRYTNVKPLVPRSLRRPVRGRLDDRGEQRIPLNADDVREAIRVFKNAGVQAVAICYMNSFANPEHERQTAALVRKAMPDAYLSVSADILPSIRFYDRVSTTVLNAYVGPSLSGYLDRLTGRLREIGFGGVLLVMQSNGGVMAPEVARRGPALTLLSGPAAGPGAGLAYARLHGRDDCITVDMGGTSFDAALVRDGTPSVITEGRINRYRVALPMLDIVTIGAGGGSIGWIDEGGLLRMGPESAGADPGPVSYGKGGTRPTCTDADLILGYLDPDFFAGGKMKLDGNAAERAIETHIARPMGLSVEAAAAGMYRIINTNMSQGVREITVKRGLDPREFPLVAAGGAGPLHACMICHELEIPMFIVPRESSIFCAAGMLMCDLQHDFVCSFISLLGRIDWPRLRNRVEEMNREGDRMLANENLPPDRRRFSLKLDCRYHKQYHEVSFPITMKVIRDRDEAAIASAFHAEHKRMYGYSLEPEGSPIELINVRLRAIGQTEKPALLEEPNAGPDTRSALKGERRMFIPENDAFGLVGVYDGHKTHHGNHIAGPALIEQVNTSLFVSSTCDCVCDKCGSFVVYQKNRKPAFSETLQEALP